MVQEHRRDSDLVEKFVERDHVPATVRGREFKQEANRRGEFLKIRLNAGIKPGAIETCLSSALSSAEAQHYETIVRKSCFEE